MSSWLDIIRDLNAMRRAQFDECIRKCELLDRLSTFLPEKFGFKPIRHGLIRDLVNRPHERTRH